MFFGNVAGPRNAELTEKNLKKPRELGCLNRVAGAFGNNFVRVRLGDAFHFLQIHAPSAFLAETVPGIAQGAGDAQGDENPRQEH